MVALLPGSRRSEIQHIAPGFLQAAARLQRERPALRFVLPVAPGCARCSTPLVAAHAPGLPLQLLDGRSHEALAACDLTLIASGTATLEAALFKRPMVIGYRMHPLSWQLMKRMAYQPWVGLPNILCRDFVVPERIQSACTPAALAADVLAGLDDAAGAERLRARFAELHHELRRDTARAATDAIAQVLGLTAGPRGAGAARPGLGVPGLVAGVDEAGRGPLAGPVVAAAVILDERAPIRGLADSKMLTARARERLYDEIRARALALCDRRGQRRGDRPPEHPAGHAAGDARAVEGLRLLPRQVLVDGNRLPVLPMPATAIVEGRRHGGGDLGGVDPGQGAPRPPVRRRCTRCGRSTASTATRATRRAAHLAALRAHGACPAHRRSFAPVRAALDRCR